jgi:dTDP-4-dehydrorhamnose reductase
MRAIAVNIMGTVSLVNYCICHPNIRLSYISSEYVFSGNTGQYTIESKLDPINVYGKTKASAEYMVSIVTNHQILRVPFIRKRHPNVFVNQYCSRYFVEDVLEKIIHNVLYNETKLVHISNERKTLCAIYEEKNIPVNKIHIPPELKSIIPKDTSLINTSPI